MPMLASTSSTSPSTANGSSSACRSFARNRERAFGASDLGQEDGELVAAEAGDGVAGAQRRLQPRAELLEQQIATLVAERVVDLLEAVEIEQHHGDAAAFAAGCEKRLLHPVGEEQAVREPGERVV